MRIYRSEAGESEILSLYDKALGRLDFDFEEIRLDTSFGLTNVLVAGEKDAPPLVFLPGGNFLNPSSLSWFSPLARRFRVYSPDIIGQPGKSAPVRPSSKSDGHARWIGEVMDGLNLEDAPFVGISYGAGIALRVAGYSPERITRAVLISPSGLVRGSILRMIFEVVTPMVLYQLSPGEAPLDRATRPLLTKHNESLARQIGAVYRNVKLDTDLPRKATKEELKDFHSPVTVFASDRDIFFPGESVIERAREVIPNLAHTEILRSSHHIPSGEGFARINERSIPFLVGADSQR